MKKIILVVILLSIILLTIACTEQPKDKRSSYELEAEWENEDEWEEDLYEEEEVNFSLETDDEADDEEEEDLFEVIKANANGDTSLAIEYIQFATEDLEQEGMGYEDELGQSFQDDINQLSKYADAISDGDINDSKQVDNYLIETEMIVAYNYLKITQLYLEEAEEADAELSLTYSIEKMLNASKILENQSKNSLIKLIESGELLLESESDWQNNLQKLIKETANWLKQNKSKLIV